METRVHWIDNCKALAICLIALGHMQSIDWISEIIFSYILPTFFFASGYTFVKSAEMPFGKLLQKKFRSLIIPYFGFSAVLLAFWYFIRRNFGLICQSSDINPSDILLQILCGVNSEFFITPLWFLTCLFVTECLFWILLRFPKKHIAGTIIFFLFFWGIYYFTYIDNQQFSHILWNVDRSCFYLYFLVAGYIVSKRGIINRFLCSSRRNALAILVGMAVFTSLFTLRNGISASWLVLPVQAVLYNVALFTFIAIAKVIPQNPLLDFIGKNTLTILALHMMVQSLLRGALFKLFQVYPETLRDSFVLSSVLTIISIVLLFPAIILINRFIPWLAGRARVSRDSTPKHSSTYGKTNP